MKHLTNKLISRRRKAKGNPFGTYAYLLLLLAAMTFTCCSDKDLEGGESDKIQLLTHIQTFDHEGGSQALKLESGSSWVVSVDENAKSWCSLSPTSGSRHNHDVTLIVQPNTSTEERNTRITFSNTFTYPPHSINALVTQKHPDALTITSNKITIPSDGGKTEVELRSNLTAEYTIDATSQSWIHSSTTRAMTRQVFSFTIDENTRPEPREGYIIVHAGQLTERVTIYQEGKVPHLVLSNHRITALSCDNVVKVEMNSNINYYYDLPQVDWLYEPETRAISTYTHYIGVRENSDYKPRQIDIVFYSSLTDETDTLHLTQMGRDALVAAYPEYWFDDCDHDFGLMLNTDARLEYKINCEWIKIKKVPTITKFDETYSIYDYVFSIENNTSDTPRSGSITFTTKSGTSQTVLIHQGRCNSQMRMVVSHNAPDMPSPTLHGTHVSGTIDWGDGQTESYRQSEKHEYKDDTPRRVTLDSRGARDVTLHSLVGVSDVTFQVNGETENEGTESFEQDFKEWEE